MENLQIQVGVMKTIILFIKTTTKASKSFLQVAKTFTRYCLFPFCVHVRFYVLH